MSMTPVPPSPSERLLRNIASSWGQMVLAAVIAFFLSPFLVHTLGTERYGVWALIFSIIGYMTLLDAGMKQSLARFLSKHYATRDWQGLNETVNTSTAIYGVTGTLVILVTVVVAQFFVGAFNVPPDLIPTMRIALVVVGLNQAVTFFFMTGTAIGPFHRYDISNAIEMAFALLSAAATVAVLKFGHGLVTLAWTVLAVNTLRYLVRRYVQQRLVPDLRFAPRFIKRERMRELLHYGWISFLIVVSWLVVFHVQNIIVGLFVSASAVAYYNIAGQVLNYLRTTVNAIGIPLVPAVSHFDAVAERERIAGLHLRISGYLYYLTTTIGIGVLFFGRQFIVLWMGPEFGATVTILMILIVPACLSLPQAAANSVLLGMSRHKALLYVLLAEAGANLTLSIILVRSIGLVGVAWGTAIPQLVIYTLVYPRVFQRIIGDDLGRFYAQAARHIGLAALCALPAAGALHGWNPIAGWPGFFLNAGGVGLVAAAGFFFLALGGAERAKLAAALRRRLPGAS